LRRQSLLLHVRPDLRFVAVRGTVDTRLRKLGEGEGEGECDALVLALAGLDRLGVREVGIRPLPPEVCLPAVGQGALAIETRIDDAATRALVEPLSHGPSVAAITAERAFLRRLGGGCLAPAAAHARLDGDGRLAVDAVVCSPDGRCVLGERETGDPAEAAAIGRRLAERLLVGGAAQLLERARATAGRAQGDATA
jgi:hydroxymethylbilane synthase